MNKMLEIKEKESKVARFAKGYEGMKTLRIAGKIAKIRINARSLPSGKTWKKRQKWLNFGYLGQFWEKSD